MGCKNFACVYATKDGCSIKGYLDDGKKKQCHFNVLCIRAHDCTYCIRDKGKSDKCLEH